MKLINILLVPFFIFFHFFLSKIYTQNGNKFLIKSSEIYNAQLNNASFIANMLSIDNDILIIKKAPWSLMDSKKMIIERYDSNLEQKFEKQLLFINSDKKELNYENAFMIKNKPIVFTSFYDKTNDEKLLYFGILNQNGVLENNKIIGRIKTNKSENGEFNYIFNEDSTKILIFERSLQYSNKPASFSFTVYDSSFETICKSKITLKSKLKEVEFVDVQIDNKGRVFVLIREEDNENPNNKFKQELLLVENGHDNTISYNLNLQNNIIKNIAILKSSNDNIMFFGVITNSKLYHLFDIYNYITGTFYLNLDISNGKITSKKINNFSKKTLDFYNISVNQLENGKGIAGISLNSITKNNKNSNYNIDLKNYFTSINPNTKFVCGANSPINVEIDSSGNIVEEVVIPIKIRCLRDFGHKHLNAYINNKPLYIYNSDEVNLKFKNENEKDIEQTTVYALTAKPTLTYSLIDGNKIATGELFSNSTDNFYLNSNVYLQLNNNTIVFAAYKRNTFKFKLVKLTLN